MISIKKFCKVAMREGRRAGTLAVDTPRLIGFRAFYFEGRRRFGGERGFPTYQTRDGWIRSFSAYKRMMEELARPARWFND